MGQGIFFKTLAFRNFLSFGNVETVVDLSRQGTIHVLGENLDTGGASGAGKTTILNAITFALYDRAISAISKERLINRTNGRRDTRMEVRLEFEKDDVEYVVHRVRGETNTARLYVNGEDKTPDSIANLNKEIESILGISYELFCRVVIFLGSDRGFLELPVAQQRQQIEELFKITTLSEKATRLKAAIKETEKEIALKEAEIKAAQAAQALRQKHIAEAERRVVSWEQQQEARIAALRERLESIAGIDFDGELKKAAELRELTDAVGELTTARRALDAELTREGDKLKRLTAELEHVMDGRCPYCLQSFQSADKVAELRDQIAELDRAIGTRQEERLALDDEIGALTARVEALRASLTVPNIEELNETRLNAAALQAQLEQLTHDKNPHVAALESLLAEDDATIDTAGLDELRDQLSHQQFLLKLLSDKSSFIRKAILNKSIPLLNRQLQHYTKELGLPHVVRFTADMDCEISEYGRELDFGNLSGGERTRVNISLSLAFRDVMRYLHCPVNIMMADELDAGTLDAATMDAIIRLLKGKSRAEQLGVWCISHRQEMMGRLDYEVIVRKERGFSTISQEQWQEPSLRLA